MKPEKRLTAFILALVLTFGLMVEASAASTAEEISACISDGVTVEYNFEPQTLRDANGNPVCPLSYNDTFYLPARTLGNVLGIAVEWEEATRTVLLGEAAGDSAAAGDRTGAALSVGIGPEIRAYLAPDITVRYNGEVRTMTDAAGNPVYPVYCNDTTYLPIRAVSDMLGVKVYWDEGAQKVLLGAFDAADTEILGEKHIGCDWVEIDWSTSGEGYFRVKLTEELTDYTICTARWRKKGNNSISRPYSGEYALTLDQWTAIPLLAGSTEYTVSAAPVYGGDDLPDEGYILPERKSFRVSFTANVDDLDQDALFLLSTGYVDYENAPETCAKALEITGNCTTDAEKITEVFQYVAENIQYDHDLVDRELAAIEANEPVPPRDLALDHILDSKLGVCEHKALLMAGMLRSLGIPCKVVSGMVTTPDVSGGHAWVSVRPGTGELDLEALGAGTDGDWIRLDPTNYQSPNLTSNDDYYSVRNYC